MPDNLSALDYDEEINLVLSALSDYYATTCERVQYQKKCEQMLLNAYISGTGIMYTYWDSEVCTGLYLNENRQTQIKGDIAAEVLDVENVYFGDGALDDIQRQPFIIIAQKLYLDKVKQMAAKNRISLEIKPDSIHIMKKILTINKHIGKVTGENRVNFCGGDFEIPTDGFEVGDEVIVYVPFTAITLTDDESDGVIGANVTQSLYKGTYYQVQVFTDSDEDFYIDTSDEWDMDDRVGIVVDGSQVKLERYEPEKEAEGDAEHE